MNGSFEPPWKLNGEGIIIPFLSRRSFPSEIGFFSDEDKLQFRGGMGAIMAVNYRTSNVGPYYELLYIPGNFFHSGKKYKRITKIFVSSEASVIHGRKNWGIPKEQADFKWIEERDQYIQVEVSKDGVLFFEMKLQKGTIPLPVLTTFYPITLLQKQEDHYLSTEFYGSGIGKISSVVSYHSDKLYFPGRTEVSTFQLPSIYVNQFHITFPNPKRINL